MIIKITALFSFLILVGCTTKEHKLDFIIEQDSKVESVSIAQYQQLDHVIPSETLSAETLGQVVEYQRLYKSNNLVSEKHRKLAIAHNQIVNNQIYNFFVAINIKSDTDFSKFPGLSDDHPHYFQIKRCESPYDGGGEQTHFTADTKKVEKVDGFFHYTLYAESNYLAALFILNDVSDLCLKYGIISNGAYATETWDINSNEIIIKAEEVEAMLDKLGIAH
jgi:hypothetical protein